MVVNIDETRNDKASRQIVDGIRLGNGARLLTDVFDDIVADD